MNKLDGASNPLAWCSTCLRHIGVRRSFRMTLTPLPSLTPARMYKRALPSASRVPPRSAPRPLKPRCFLTTSCCQGLPFDALFLTPVSRRLFVFSKSWSAFLTRCIVLVFVLCANDHAGGGRKEKPRQTGRGGKQYCRRCAGPGTWRERGRTWRRPGTEERGRGGAP